MGIKHKIGLPIAFEGFVNKFFPDDVHGVVDNFNALDTELWDSVDDGSTGTNVLTDTVGGSASIVTAAAADNDYHLMTTQKKVFKFEAGKPLFLKAKFLLTEAATDNANFVIGLSSVTTTGFVADDGGGPPATYDGAVVFKVDGGTKLQCEVSDGSTQTTNTTAKAFVSGTSYEIAIYFDGVDRVSIYIDDEEVAGVTIDPANFAEMYVIYGPKAGGSSAETLEMQYIRCHQER